MEPVHKLPVCCAEYWIELSPSLQEVGVLRCVFVLQVVEQVWDESLIAVAVLLWGSLVYRLQTCLYLPVKNYA